MFLLFTPETGEWKPTEHQHRSDLQRGIGVADMAQCIEAGELHRANGAMALHVLEAMIAFAESSGDGQFMNIESKTQRPDALPANLI